MRFAVGLILALVAAVLALLTWLFATSNPVSGNDGVSALPQTRPRHQGDWYVGNYWTEPKHLNPFTSSDHIARSCVLFFTHDSLMRLDPATAKPAPSLATIVEQSEDGRKVVFELREAYFSDGSRVTVDDVLFTLDVVQDKETPVGSIMQAVDSIRRITPLGGNKFRVEMKERHFAGVEAMATDYPVVKKQYYVDRVRRRAMAAGEETVPTQPGQPGFARFLAQIERPGPGTGPYKIARWNAGRQIDLDQNTHSWHRTVYPKSWNLAGIRLLFITDLAADFAELRLGRLDWYSHSNPDQLMKDEPTVARLFVCHDYDHVKKGHEMVVWNHRRKHLQDRRVRRALTMLFDRPAIAKKLLHGRGKVAVSWFKPGNPEYPTNLKPLEFDPGEARKLLADAGYGGDKPLEVTILAAQRPDGLYRRILDMALPDFQRAGVKLVPKVLMWLQVQARRDQGDFDGFLVQWFHGGPHIDPYGFFHSSEIGQGLNWGSYHNDEVDTLLEKAQQELDPEARRKLYQRFNEIVHFEQPVTLLVHVRSTILLHKRFRDAEPGLMGLVPQRWWVKSEEVRYHR